MQRQLLQILACPKCLGELDCTPIEVAADGEIETGNLTCAACERSFEIIAGIPRFVLMENYASSFGYQWNQFKAEQIDSINGTTLSQKRFRSETNWTSEWMQDTWILDAGCGAGRFLDVASKTNCQVVGVDMSSAADAARVTLGNRKNIHLVQATLNELPFRSEVFDGCYCIGVIQHTPDPENSVRSLPRVLKPGGRLALTMYERTQFTKLHAKYLIRPVTRRLGKRTLLYTLKGLMPLLFPITEVAFRIPFAKRLFMHMIPVANYVNETELSIGQRYHWALMETFDMLAPQYDQPQRESEVRQALEAEGIEAVERLPNEGLNLVGRKGGESFATGVVP